jgi:hypothetical protein
MDGKKERKEHQQQNTDEAVGSPAPLPFLCDFGTLWLA